MTIKVTNCSDCIFRESDYDPNSPGYDTVDSCILLRDLLRKGSQEIISYHIATYDSFNEELPEALNKRLEDCPLHKKQIIVTLCKEI